MQLIEMSLGDNGTILIEVPESSGTYKVGKVGHIIDATDKAFGKLVETEIVESAKALAAAFEKLKDQPVRPKKAVTEFGLQFNGSGNIFMASVSAQATIKVSIEWDMP